jgi:hypothetical protein
VVLIDGIQFHTMDKMNGEIYSVIGANGLGDSVGHFKQGIAEFNYDSEYYCLKQNCHAAGAYGFNKVDLEANLINGFKFLISLFLLYNPPISCI